MFPIKDAVDRKLAASFFFCLPNMDKTHRLSQSRTRPLGGLLSAVGLIFVFLAVAACSEGTTTTPDVPNTVTPVGEVVQPLASENSIPTKLVVDPTTSEPTPAPVIREIPTKTAQPIIEIEPTKVDENSDRDDDGGSVQPPTVEESGKATSVATVMPSHTVQIPLETATPLLTAIPTFTPIAAPTETSTPLPVGTTMPTQSPVPVPTEPVLINTPIPIENLASDFTLPSIQGSAYSLSQFRNEKPVAIVFYRAYW